MSQFISMLALTRLTTAAVIAGTFVTPAGATATAGGHTLGVTRVDAAEGDAMLVDCLGTAPVIAGDAIADGDEVEVGVDGHAVPKDEGVTVGIALEGGAAGELVEIFLIPNASAPVDAG